MDTTYISCDYYYQSDFGGTPGRATVYLVPYLRGRDEPMRRLDKNAVFFY